MEFVVICHDGPEIGIEDSPALGFYFTSIPPAVVVQEDSQSAGTHNEIWPVKQHCGCLFPDVVGEYPAVGFQFINVYVGTECGCEKATVGRESQGVTWPGLTGAKSKSGLADGCPGQRYFFVNVRNIGQPDVAEIQVGIIGGSTTRR